MPPSTLSLIPLLKTGFDVWRIEAPRFLIYGIFMTIMSILSGLVPMVGPLVNLAIEGPLVAGAILATQRVLSHEIPEIEDFTGGFKLLIPLMAVAFLRAVASITGLFALILPGIAIYTLLSLAIPIVLFERERPVQALITSWKRVLPAFWVVLTIGMLFGLMSLLITWPALETLFSGDSPLLGSQAPSMDALLPGLLGSCLLSPLSGIYVTLVYFHLREDQTGTLDTHA
jgi:hypothetical protein